MQAALQRRWASKFSWLLIVFWIIVSIGSLQLGRTPKDHITQQNLARIRLGMSEQQVEAILGGPAGDYRTETCTYFCNDTYLRGETQKEWTGNEGCICVGFDASGRVVGTWASFDVLTVRCSFPEKAWDRLCREPGPGENRYRSFLSWLRRSIG